jgi:branched-chain amino acid transport system ATP-binding protein
MPQAEPLLEIAAVEAVYNHAIVALHEVSLKLHQGEILALLGANGAGKTTTLKALSNLLPAERGAITKGQIRFAGLDVRRAKPSALVRHGLVQVLEGRHCFRSLTVEENLITGALGRSSSRREAAADLERVYAYFPRLKEKRKAKSGLTSGGEQQRRSVAH